MTVYPEFMSRALEVVGESALIGPVRGALLTVNITKALIGATKGISDHLLLTKVEEFCQFTNNVSSETKTKWLKKQQETPEECKRTVTQLLLYIEKADEFNKLKTIAALFIAWIHKEITEGELSRLVYTVNQCFANDVLKLVEPSEAPEKSDEAWMRSLHVSLTRQETQVVGELGSGAPLLRTSRLGKQLRRAYKRGLAEMY